MKRKERKDYEQQIEELNRRIKGLTDDQIHAMDLAAHDKDALTRSRNNERAALRKIEELEEEIAEMRRKLYLRERVERGIFGFDCDGDHVRGVFDDKCLRCRKSTDEEGGEE